MMSGWSWNTLSTPLGTSGVKDPEALLDELKCVPPPNSQVEVLTQTLECDLIGKVTADVIS